MNDYTFLDRALLQAAQNGDASLIKQCLASRHASGASLSLALAKAAENGHYECVFLFLADHGLDIDRSSAVEEASRHGNDACLALLIDGPDPKAISSLNSALLLAVMYGHLNCVNRLIPISDPKANRSAPLASAAERGRVECVEALIPVSGPLADRSRALSLAAYQGQARCVSLLLPVSDPLAKDESGKTPAEKARSSQQFDVVGMIEAFIETQELRLSLSIKAPTRSRPKHGL